MMESCVKSVEKSDFDKEIEESYKFLGSIKNNIP